MDGQDRLPKGMRVGGWTAPKASCGHWIERGNTDLARVPDLSGCFKGPISY